MLMPSSVARRSFLRSSGLSIGSMALANLMTQSSGHASRTDDSQADDSQSRNGALKTLHFAPKAKRVIWLYMAGGMSHLDTFDNKPKLVDLDGQPMPESVTKGQQIAQ